MNYDVNPDELRKLAVGLRQVRATVDQLGRLGQRQTGPEAALGSAAVARQLHEVSCNWSKARAVLAEQLAALAAAADACARTYDGVEGELADAMAPR